MKEYELENGKRLFALKKGISFLFPSEISRGFAYGGIRKIECGGFKKESTKNGRILYRILSGKGWIASLYEGGGSRNWKGFGSNRMNQQEYLCQEAGGISLAEATSNGGGCWVEFWIFPAVCPFEKDTGRPQFPIPEEVALSPLAYCRSCHQWILNPVWSKEFHCWTCPSCHKSLCGDPLEPAIACWSCQRKDDGKGCFYVSEARNKRQPCEQFLEKEEEHTWKEWMR
ncbi:MAG TPA: hypothetical protein PLD14_03375 [Candidatus Pacearchaeota archaeon]|nr:hypothetical protein [Candidatus Pacearchaeota archaeon]HPR80239.1 hypothetical protein [Candidatus Pacearchaeota archaeon]